MFWLYKMLAFKEKPNSVKTKFDNYFVGAPMTNKNSKYPLLNSGNGVGATFEKWTDTNVIDTNMTGNVNNEIFYRSEIYGNEMQNKVGIPKNIDTVYKYDESSFYKYPSNTFFEVPDDWIMADTWFADITVNLENGSKITSYSMFHKKQKSNYLNTVYNRINVNYENFNDNYKNSYDAVINPDMLYVYGKKLGKETSYYSYTKSNEYWYLWGGMLYDFGWWYRINQVGVNSMFYPQNAFNENPNEKIPIWNLTSIVNSILNFNKNVYSQEGLGLINAVAPCIVKTYDYATLEWGPMNNSYGDKKCSKGNTLLYIKAARTPTGVNNPNIPYFYINVSDGTKYTGLYEAAFPPFYGCFEMSTGVVNKRPDQYYTKSGKLIGKPSKTHYIIKENQFGICPQIPRAKLSENNTYINSVFTVYILKINFFKSPPDHKPWWCFRDAYETLDIDFSQWFNNPVEQYGKTEKYRDFALLNHYNITDEDKRVGHVKKMRELLKDIKFDRIFEERNEAIIIYPSSLILYQRFDTSIDGKKDSVYNLINSPGLILRDEPKNVASGRYDYEYYIRLRPVDHYYIKGQNFPHVDYLANILDSSLYKNDNEWINVINNPWTVPGTQDYKSKWMKDNPILKHTAGSSKYNMVD